MNAICAAARDAGIVGAGGAGFPTHEKLARQAKIVLVNGSECEPLLRVDQQLAAHWPERLLRGTRLAMEATGATEGVIALKAKYKPAIAALQPLLPADIDIHVLKDVYPAGDEVITIWLALGRVVPAAHLPFDVGVAVSNVQTLLNLARAVDDGLPVITRTLTVGGAVRTPLTATVPVGTPVADLLALAGGPTIDDWVVIDGGPMMGPLIHDLAQPVTKTTGGLIVLPRDHLVVRRREASMEAVLRIARTNCDQCALCTELCPRHIVGHELPPHLIVRSLNYNHVGKPSVVLSALTCSECGVCEAYACPCDISPMRINIALKTKLRSEGVRYEGLLRPPDRLAEHRLVPTARLIARIGVGAYDVPAPLVERTCAPERVVLRLRQHIGAAARPVVKQGDRVECGQLVGEIPDGALGARVHASIAGRVTEVGDDAVVVCA